MRLVFAKIGCWLGLLLLGGGAVGCCGPNDPRQFDTITITLDDSLRDASNNLPRIEVNLVGSNDTDLARWEKIPVSQYFQSQHEADTTVVVILGEDRQSQSVTAKGSDAASMQYTDRIWKEKAKNLVVLCDYPPPKAGVATDADPRRLILPLVCSRWPHDQKEIKIRVSALGLTVTTPPLPPG